MKMTKEKAKKYLAEQRDMRDYWRRLYVENERDENQRLDIEYLDFNRAGMLWKMTERKQRQEEYLFLIHRANRIISELERVAK